MKHLLSYLYILVCLRNQKKKKSKNKNMRLLKCIIMAFGICYITNLNAQTDNITRKRSEKQNVQSVQTRNTSQRYSGSRQTTNRQSTASYSNGELTVNGISYVFVKVQSGSFTMGATPEMQNPYDDEKPAHQVSLTNNYYIGKTEVTQALWQTVMGDNPSLDKGANKPVENVTWDDCQIFISKLNAMTGKSFRLPTEAEWEFAARGGNKTRNLQYSGSNNLAEVAWYKDNSENRLHDVAKKKPNELGIYDMSGNVWEWCSDWYGDYSSSPQTNPLGSKSGEYRVNRGGCYSYDNIGCRSSYRGYDQPDSGDNIGFRLAISSL